MAITVTCPSGHCLRVKDEFAGKSGLCPFCHVRVNVPARGHAFEDDVLSIMGPPRKAPSPEPSSDSIYDAPNAVVRDDAQRESGVCLMGSSLLRRKKICPQCCHIVSFAFTICPRCGTPLAVCVNSQS